MEEEVGREYGVSEVQSRLVSTSKSHFFLVGLVKWNQGLRYTRKLEKGRVDISFR